MASEGACHSLDADNADILAAGAETGGGNVALEAGAVNVYTRTGGAWSPPVILTASDGKARDRLGYSVSLSGGSLAAGAYGSVFLRRFNVSPGAVYVFTLSDGTWGPS